MLFFHEVNHGVFNVLCGLNLNSSFLVMNEKKKEEELRFLNDYLFCHGQFIIVQY